MTVDTARKRQRTLVLGLHLIALAVLALQAYVRRLPATATAIPEANSAEARWWGLWPVTYLPDWLFWAGAAAIFGWMAYAWWRELSMTPRPSSRVPVSGRPGGWTVLLAICGLLFVAFFAFPIVHTRWGDAYILSRAIAWPEPELRLTRSWQAPLDVFLHSVVWHVFEPYTGWDDAVPVYRLLSPIAGGIYLFALLMLSRNRRFAPGWLTYGLLATLGIMQLFFGYVENYSFSAAFVLVYLWLGIGVAQRRAALWPAATALAMANALHPSTLVLLPSLAYLAWLLLRDPGTHGNIRATNNVLHIAAQLAAPYLLIFGLTWIIMESGNHGLTALFTVDRPGGGDARWLVPFRQTTTQWERYTMFSWQHLREFVNEQLLVAPVVLPSMLVVGLASLRQARSGAVRRNHRTGVAPYALPDRPLALYLVVAFLSYLLFTWLWNPDYGGQRDWDLFSLVAIPEALLLAYLMARTLSPWRYLVMAAAPLIAVQALHTASWIYQNTLPWSWP